jgi:hypothetical protein
MRAPVHAVDAREHDLIGLHHLVDATDRIRLRMV